MNQLFYGDNLPVMRESLKDESVDLIYLDPPFNSKRGYNLLFKTPKGHESEAQIEAFEDTWHWGQEAEEEFDELIHQSNTGVAQLMKALRTFLGENDVMAYLTMMAIRLVELHRVLKPTGSMYLHCDPTASHYLKMVLDGMMGKENFRNEIVWHYKKWAVVQAQFVSNHDVIFFYSKTTDKRRAFKTLLMERAPSTLKRFGKAKIISGHDAAGHRIPAQMDEEESEGVAMDDVWDIGRVPPIKQLFPTQKPDALLQRIIEASSNEGDLVLDPFCGCGTTILNAQKLRRNWIGIDITCLAISLVEKRLKKAFGRGCPFEVHGTPKDFESAADLARRDKYQFQWWAVSLVDAQPARGNKKGADAGIDGIKFFRDIDKKEVRKIVVSVKGGRIKPDDVRALNHVRERDGADIGLFITLQQPTRGMAKDAASAGLYESPNRKKYARIQLLAIEELLNGKQRAEHPDYEPDLNFRKAEEESSVKQEGLEL